MYINLLKHISKCLDVLSIIIYFSYSFKFAFKIIDLQNFT